MGSSSIVTIALLCSVCFLMSCGNNYVPFHTSFNLHLLSQIFYMEAVILSLFHYFAGYRTAGFVCCC